MYATAATAAWSAQLLVFNDITFSLIRENGGLNCIKLTILPNH
jgi:hypothetical protein